MRERVKKLLRPWNRAEKVIDQCIDWVEFIVNRKNSHLVGIYLVYLLYLVISSVNYRIIYGTFITISSFYLMS